PLSLERLEEIDAPSVGAPAAILARWTAELPAPPAIFVGDGADLFQQEIAQTLPDARGVPTPLIAGAIGRLAVARAGDAAPPAAVRPLYVRRPDAEIARDARP